MEQRQASPQAQRPVSPNSQSTSPQSHQTNLTTPEKIPSAGEGVPRPATGSNDDDDDIWAANSPNPTTTSNPELLSDLPSLRRQHMNSGYRDGLSAGKAKVMQAGFDDGYPIGVAIALRAGRVLGVLEGVLAAKGIRDQAETRRGAETLLKRAKEELGRERLMEGVEEAEVARAKDLGDLGSASVEDALRRLEGVVDGLLTIQSGEA
jgi:hypothetical protein